MNIYEKSRPSFSDYYVSQIISLAEKGRRITKNKRTLKSYEEVNFKLHQIILYILVFAACPIGAIIINSVAHVSEDRSNVYALFSMIAVLIALLTPLRFFFVKFKEVIEEKEGGEEKSDGDI